MSKKPYITRLSLLVPAGMVLAMGGWAARYMYEDYVWRPAAVGAMLSRAYAEDRTLELRLEEVEFSSLRASRGAETSDQLPALIEAQQQIAAHTDYNDPTWLDLKGRLQLLRGDSQAALINLLRAHEAQPKSAPILTDLATAYFEKAQSDGSDDLYGAALELLGEALRLEPKNAMILYNCALVEERQFLYRASAEHWQEYLTLDQVGGWSAEAARHLASIQQKLALHTSGISKPLLTPEAIASAATGDKAALLAEIETRVEEYSETAAEEWLPQAYSAPGNIDTTIALRVLAGHLHRVHHDAWLEDFLSATPKSTATEKAVRSLSRAIHANVTGNASDALTSARRANHLFLAAADLPGMLRAQVEEVHALRQSFSSKLCVHKSEKLESALGQRRYPQLQAKAMLEKTSCLFREGLQPAGLKTLAIAGTAVKFGLLPSQQINVLNYQSAIEELKGEANTTWQMSRAGLLQFWNGLYPDKRAYPFYIRLADWAEDNNEPFVFLQFAREAATTIDGTNLTSFRAMAHYRYAEAALANGRYDVAQDEFNRAEKIFQVLPQNEEIASYRLDVEVLLANLEARRKEFDLASKRLEKLAPHIATVQSFLTEYEFYSARAAVSAGRSQNDAAEAEYRQAIAAAESVLRSVKGERERLTWSHQYGNSYRGLSQILLRQNRFQEALQTWEMYRGSDLRSFAPLSANSGVTKEAAKFAAIQREIGDKVALVYMFTADGLAMWAVSKTRIDFHLAKIDQQAMAAEVRRLLFLCSKPTGDLEEIRSHSQRLYQTLLGPFENTTKLHPLIFEPDGELTGIPFELLLDAQSRYLIESHTLSYLPSLLYLSHLRNDSQQGNYTALVVGVSSVPERYRKSLAQLPGAEREAESVARLLPNAHLFSGQSADADRVLPWLANSRIFHFSGHSIYDHGKLELLLAESGDGAAPLLNISALHPSQFRTCRLVVLSACSTQRLSGESFHEPQNAIRTILQAGVPHILASRWDIDSETTAQFMEEFYRDFSFNKDVGHSLAYAMKRARERQEHPYYWAAFSQFGNN